VCKGWGGAQPFEGSACGEVGAAHIQLLMVAAYSVTATAKPVLYHKAVKHHFSDSLVPPRVAGGAGNTAPTAAGGIGTNRA